jgi:hypothetical protein
VAGYVVAEETGERTELFGAAPRGYAIFDADGRMMAILAASDRVAGTSVADMAELFRSMVAYSGRWSIDGERFVTEVDLASDPSWIGTAQVRYYAFDGRTLSLRTALIQHPSFPGRMAVVYAEWEREG